MKFGTEAPFWKVVRETWFSWKSTQWQTHFSQWYKKIITRNSHIQTLLG